MGDLAQYFCIREWIGRNYPSLPVYEFEATTIVDTRFGFLGKLARVIKPNDLIFFQSGFTTADRGGCHELMHRVVIDRFPTARILMMPQTIFFHSEENRLRTSKSYNQARNMLFLSRDKVSYEQALKMFPDVQNVLYPDIVTSLIGKYNFQHQRHGIFMCCRNDYEKFYSADEMDEFASKLSDLDTVDMGDTTISTHYLKIRENLGQFVSNQIELFSKYKLTITDRYHGTIFSLAANTPVIVIKTKDHKVTTGADWFKGVYDDSVMVAESLDHAYELAQKILASYDYPVLQPFFKEKYYDALPARVAQLGKTNVAG
ncbi:Putative pyruvyl transferase EpsI [Pontiella sulfatireligans]|uniref:Pyruvyl transferase EpsI n=2 Tax=Pontiella sulfatireligans TaxID=2750658 RepID=A0A6C2UEC1_9BACT|nr:Putative pyruvyl transferase EpsI [Pontiella sulfatireligans]